MKPTCLIALLLAAGLAAACEKKEAPKSPPVPKVSALAPVTQAPAAPAKHEAKK